MMPETPHSFSAAGATDAPTDFGTAAPTLAHSYPASPDAEADALGIGLCADAGVDGDDGPPHPTMEPTTATTAPNRDALIIGAT